MRAISRLLPVICLGVLHLASATGVAAQCIWARELASYASMPQGLKQLRFDTNGAENAGHEIGRFWQSSNSLFGNNFDGGCPSTNADPSGTWWDLTQPPLRGIRGFVSTPACILNTCPIGALTVVVEDRSLTGEDALFIGFRVDETTAEVRNWDIASVDPSPSPSIIVMQPFPSPVVSGSTGLATGDVSLDLELPDPAGNVHAVTGPADTPLPASAVVKSWDLYQYVGNADPGREAELWSLVEHVPYADGPGARPGLVLQCPTDGANLFITLGVSFNGGAGPDVPSKLVGRAVHVVCPGNSGPTAHAGSDLVAECSGGGVAVVTLDGDGSTDPQSDALSFAWSAPGVTFDDPGSPSPTASFPLGTTVATLVVSDGEFSHADAVEVTVVDTLPPVVLCTISQADPASDGHFVVELSAADACSAPTPTSAVIDLGWGSVPVGAGQLLDLECTGNAECGSVTTCGNTLALQVPNAKLVVDSVDSSGNTATCTSILCGAELGGGVDEKPPAGHGQAPGQNQKKKVSSRP